MGKHWRRISERLRQHVMAPHFQPASTERNQMMYREAAAYFNHFKTVIKKLTRLMKNYNDLTSSVHALLECRVPRMYTVESDGSVGAEMHDGDAFLGTGIQIHRLTTSSQTMNARMSEEVISTLQQWFTSFERCKTMLHELEELKYESDSRRRTVMSLDVKRVDFEGKAKEDATREAQLAATSAKLQHKERKFDLCLAEFQQKEEKLNQEMRALLSEVRGLAELIGHVYQILSDAPNDAHKAFKEGTTSGVQPPLMITPHLQQKESGRTEPTRVADRSNPFLTPPASPTGSPTLRTTRV